MPTGGGFYSSEQEANFKAANVLHRRGGQAETVCGARTRAGGHCRGKPIIGSKRCLKHAGPHAARAFRERQLLDLARGKISLEEFSKYEARRAANRLRDQWKKNPWLPGTTIQLGEYEQAFIDESGLAHGSEPVAPALLDWLRWRYRRLQIDRKRDAEWIQVLRIEFPRRVRDMGVPSKEDLITLEQRHTPGLWTVGKPVPFSRRHNLDRPKLETKPKRGALPRIRLRDDDPEALARILCEHHLLLGQLFAKCRDAAEKLSVIAALQSYLSDPTEPKAVQRWAETVRLLNNAVV